MKVLKFFLLPVLLFCFSSFASNMLPVTIFMIGDSTMADKDLSKGNIERGWGQILPSLLTDGIRVENHARDGRSTRSFIAEGRWEEVVSKLKKGDYVFIQFGHNDEKTDSTLHTVPGGSFDENLRRFVRETKAKGAIPVLFNSIVRRNFPPEGMKEHRYVYEEEGTVLVDTHGAYRDVPARVAREMDVPFVDANQLTHKLVEDLGMEESKKLFMWVEAGKYDFCPLGKVDNTHLNIEGARMVASLLIEATAKEIPALSHYLRPYNDKYFLAPYKDNKQCAISYTFDDGLQEHYTLVYPQLEKFGFKGTFWVCSKIIDDKKAALGKPRMTWEQMKEMASHGHEISNHGWSHMILKGKLQEDIRMEIARNDSVIQSHIGKWPLTFCYPGNFMDEQAMRIASEGRVGTRTYQYAMGGERSHSTPDKLEKWVKGLLVAGEWGVAMVHGITYGYDYFSDPSVLWNHLAEVKRQENCIWVATFQDIATYVRTWMNTRLEIIEYENQVTLVPHCDLGDDWIVPLTLVIDLKDRVKVEQDGTVLPVRKKQQGKWLFWINPKGGKIQIELVK